MTFGRSPLRAGYLRFGLQLRGETKAWKGLKLFGADGKELAFLTCDADHPGPSNTDVLEASRLGYPIHLELWAASPAGTRGIVEARDLPRDDCVGETNMVLWEFD